MLTRCPRCETTFRVTPEQLKARHGRVRCGHCQNVFDALDTLIEAPSQAVPATAPEGVVTTVPLAEVPLAAPEVPAESPPTPTPVEPPPAPIPTESPPASASAETLSVPVPTAPLPASASTELLPEPESVPVEEPVATSPTSGGEPSPVEAPAAETTEAITIDEIASEEASADAVPKEPEEPPVTSPPSLEPLLHEEPEQRAWPWALGSVVALTTLLLQATIHYRTEIAVLSPGVKPLLSAVCAPVNCEVSLPHKSELVGIETSNLSPDSGGKLSLSATLKNRAPFAQQFPDLELTLTDTSDQPLVRRVLAPADYLTPQALAAGFGAGSELAVNLAVDTPGVPASGYQLYLFYP